MAGRRPPARYLWLAWPRGSLGDPGAKIARAQRLQVAQAFDMSRWVCLRVPIFEIERILFTCKVCETRNSHMISRLAYQQGIVIATCPGCGNRHLLADKTGLLDVGIWDVEMLAQRGENVTRLTTDGYTQVDGELNRTSNSPGASPLLVRNKDGLLEALPEENLGVSRAVDFMADTADEAMS
ncbi:unnamed protein product [Effrenium voratum]|uniref:DNL-type domain-containing protein n=1 Tax=Effrenium voratum TaxID=2562239 RepID=A0AA36JEM4_9DINO|nr:unnamed protein product [Effrenium voratum]